MKSTSKSCGNVTAETPVTNSNRRGWYEAISCIGNREINLSTVFAGQTVGIQEVADNIWLVSFMNYDPGLFDEDMGRVEPATNPVLPEL